VASAPDDPKLNATVVPGWRRRKPAASWLKAPLSDDAADTVIDPDSRGPGVVVVVAVADEEEHAAVASATRAGIAHPRMVLRVTAG